jgi:hypothetical protein
MALNQYIGARYVPLITGEWDATISYEALSVVLYQGSSYTSICSVPVGVPPTNTAFWALTGNYNAQVEQYRQEVLNISSELSSIKPKVESNTNNINILTPKVESNTNNIDILTPKVESNTNNIDILTPKVESNTNNIDILTPKVESNTNNITSIKTWAFYTEINGITNVNADIFKTFVAHCYINYSLNIMSLSFIANTDEVNGLNLNGETPIFTLPFKLPPNKAYGIYASSHLDMYNNTANINWFAVTGSNIKSDETGVATFNTLLDDYGSAGQNTIAVVSNLFIPLSEFEIVKD